MDQNSNPHIGEDFDAYLARKRAADPAFGADLDVEYERLQLARQVRAAREAHKLTQADLAARAGTKQPAIARMERGASTPQIDALRRVARALGMRLEVRFVAQE